MRPGRRRSPCGPGGAEQYAPKTTENGRAYLAKGAALKALIEK